MKWIILKNGRKMRVLLSASDAEMWLKHNRLKLSDAILSYPCLATIVLNAQKEEVPEITYPSDVRAMAEALGMEMKE